MKNYFFILSLLVLATGCIPHKRFHRGAVVADFNTGIDAYRTTQHYRKSAAAVPNDTAISGSAANTHYAVGVELGISKRIGIGVRSKTNTFLNDIDAVTRKHAAITSRDMIFTVNLHPIVRNKFDLVIGADFGLSNLKFNFENNYNDFASSQGRYFAPYINPRFYLGRFGFNFRATIPSLNYGQFFATKELAPANYMLTKWKGSGFGFSVGVQMHIF